jgi:hypothetical protein
LSSVRKTTLYFEKAGAQNTKALLEFAKKYVEKEHVKDIVVASTSGRTGAQAVKVFKDCNVVVVAHAYGFKEPGKNELQQDYEKKILSKGGKIFSGTHALSSAERAVRKDFGTIQPLELIANVLRRFGDGTKVCIEIALMAADAGLAPVDKDIVAIGGTGHGADTALCIRTANAAKFFDLKVKEVIAKPLDF